MWKKKSHNIYLKNEYTGSITGDLNKRRGLMKGMDTKGTSTVVKADVPLSELMAQS